jgi:GT2 family glycosyltransferase
MIQPRIAILMTCHNRRNLTLRSIRSIEKAIDGAADATTILVDAGSSDGTSEEVSKLYPNVRILKRSAGLYWNSGMREGWAFAIGVEPQPDFYLWLNDDLALAPSALRQLLKEHEAEVLRSGPRVILVGKTVDPQTGSVTYGGLARNSRFSRISLRPLRADERYCVTMNGNCVLIPARAVADVGISSERFTHALGDIDYGLRATSAGYVIVQSSEPVGKQPPNDKRIYGEKKLKLSVQTLRQVFLHPKGIPLGEWLYFCRRHAGTGWPINFLMRYIRLFRL